jgi:hypothetical protein
VNRLKLKQFILVRPNGEVRGPVPGWVDPSRDFEMKILVDECLAHCDFVTREVFLVTGAGVSRAEIVEFMNSPG